MSFHARPRWSLAKCALSVTITGLYTPVEQMVDPVERRQTVGPIKRVSADFESNLTHVLRILQSKVVRPGGFVPDDSLKKCATTSTEDPRWEQDSDASSIVEVVRGSRRQHRDGLSALHFGMPVDPLDRCVEH